MSRPSLPWIWLALGAILLFLPGTAGRLLLDVLGGLTLLVILLPLIGAGVGVVAWQLVRRRLQTCATCGTTSLGSEVCPGCGASLASPTMDPTKVTINVEAVDVDPSKMSDTKQSDTKPSA